MEGLGDQPSSPSAASADVLEVHAAEELRDFQCNETVSQEGENFVDLRDENMDKEQLRKIKQKMKRSQNRRRKKLLSGNLKSFSPAELQQSVADLASSVGIRREDSFSVSSSYANAPWPPKNGHSEDTPTQASNFVPSLPNVSNPSVGTEEIKVCVMDSENSSYRFTLQDLAYINEALEKFMYTDLTVTPKLKICNSFLSWTKQVWITCLTHYTACWVIQKVKEIKNPSGKRFFACLANEVACFTMVTMLVPKECGFVDSYAGFMRLLIIHNPTLGLGTTREILHPVRSRLGPRLEVSINENSTLTNQEPDCNGSSVMSQNCPSKISIELPEKTSPCTSTEQPGPGFNMGDLDGPRLARCFTFYADDIWLLELKQLTHGPFFGLRRLQFVLGEKVVVRTGELDRNSEKMPPNSKNLRGFAGGRNRKKKVPSVKDNIEAQ